MKKLAMALAITTIVGAGAASANISSGFYIGAGVGYGASTSEVKFHRASGQNGNSFHVHDAGEESAAFRLLAGYGMVSGCWYFAGEGYYDFLDQDIRGHGSRRHIGSSVSDNGFRYHMHRHAVYGLKARVGWLLTPSAMTFIGLAIQGGEWRAHGRIQRADNGAWVRYGRHGHHGHDGHHGHGHGHGHGNHGCFGDINFVPSIGMEIAASKNVYVRGEYSYEFGRNHRHARVSDELAAQTGFKSMHFGDTNSQRFVLGVSYKF